MISFHDQLLQIQLNIGRRLSYLPKRALPTAKPTTSNLPSELFDAYYGRAGDPTNGPLSLATAAADTACTSITEDFPTFVQRLANVTQYQDELGLAMNKSGFPSKTMEDSKTLQECLTKLMSALSSLATLRTEPIKAAISSTAKLTSDLAHISVGSQWDVRPSPSTDSDVADLSPDQLTQKLFRVSMEHERRMEGMIHQSTPVFPWLDIAVLTRQWHVRDLFDYYRANQKQYSSPSWLPLQQSHDPYVDEFITTVEPSIFRLWTAWHTRGLDEDEWTALWESISMTDDYLVRAQTAFEQALDIYTRIEDYATSMLDISADILQNIHCGHFAALVVEKHGDDLLGGDYGGYKITQNIAESTNWVAILPELFRPMVFATGAVEVRQLRLTGESKEAGPRMFDGVFPDARKFSGLCYLDVADSQALRVTGGSAPDNDVNFKASDDTLLYGARLNAVFMPPVLSTGTFTRPAQPDPVHHEIIFFDKPFATTPKVACWLNGIDSGTGKGISVSCKAATVSPTHFVLFTLASTTASPIAVSTSWIAWDEAAYKSNIGAWEFDTEPKVGFASLDMIQAVRYNFADEMVSHRPGLRVETVAMISSIQAGPAYGIQAEEGRAPAVGNVRVDACTRRATRRGFSVEVNIWSDTQLAKVGVVALAFKF